MKPGCDWIPQFRESLGLKAYNTFRDTISSAPAWLDLSSAERLAWMDAACAIYEEGEQDGQKERGYDAC